MARIEELSAEQWERVRTERDRWWRIGTSTEPADRPRAEAAIAEMRRLIGAPDAPVLWCDSPATALLAILILKAKGDSLRDSLWDSLQYSLWASLGGNLQDSLRASLQASLWDSLWDSLGDNLQYSLWASLGGNLQDSLWDSLWDSLSRHLSDSLWERLRASLRASLQDSIQTSLRDSIWQSIGRNLHDSVADAFHTNIYDAFGGAHEAAWVAFYAVSADVAGVEYPEEDARRLGLWSDIAQSATWWWAFENLTIICERPVECRMDAEERLHAPDGPALLFRDGWAVHAWHGVRVPADWIEGRPAAAEVLRDPNLEKRRAGCEILGWAHILDELGAETIDADPDPTVGTLVSVGLPDLTERARFLRVRCGTGREFAKGVPPSVQTAFEAQAWLDGTDPADFRLPEIRT